MQVLLDSKTTRISFADKQSDTVFICFISLGMHEDNSLDFYSLSKQFSVFFVTDKTSSWGNRIDWDSVSGIINPLISGKQSYSIGVSMGGTNSIISSNYLNTDVVVAFNPQYTIHPDIMPDSEYIDYANRISKWKHVAIQKSFNNDKTYYTFISRGDTIDVRFIDYYPKYVFDCGEKYGHNLAFDLKNDGKLQALLSSITMGPDEIYKVIENTINPLTN